MVRLFQLLGRTLGLILRVLEQVVGSKPGTPPALSIARVRPGSGWPGSVLTIDGAGFSGSLDGNSVDVGGDTALTMSASANRLVVLAGEKTKSGPVRVTTGGTTATAPEAFEVRPWPEARDASSSGPPVFFHGPQDGTPAIGKKDMRVLVIFASAAGSPPVNVAAEIALEMVGFNRADRFWQEATYTRTSFKYEAGPWVNLPLARNEYVWDHVDEGWARDQLDPPSGGVPGVVEVTDAAGAPRLVPITTSPSGQIQADIEVAPGRYDVQVFTASTRTTAEAESIVRRVDVQP